MRSARVAISEHELFQRLERQLMSLGYQPSLDDWEYVRSVPPEGLQELLSRLTAFSELESGATTRQASAVAGVSLPTMFRLKRIWADTRARSFRSLAGATMRPKRGAGKSPELVAARKIARRLAEEKGETLSLTALATLVRKEAGGTVSLNGAERIVREVRNELRSRHDVLAQTYGREIFIDTVAVSIVVDEPAAKQTRSATRTYLALLALVVERASGLVLAARVTQEAKAAADQLAALRSVRSYLQDKVADIERVGPCRLLATIGPDLDPYSKVLARTLRQAFGDDAVRDDGPRRFGRTTLDVLGPSVGKIFFLPASTEGGVPAAAQVRALGRVPVSLARAQAIVDRTMDDHNERILSTLRAAEILPLATTLFRPGAMYRAMTFLEPKRATAGKVWG